MEGISWEAVVGGGNSPRGNYSGVIVQGEFFWGNFIGGNCPGGIFPGGNYQFLIVWGKSGVNCHG